MKWKKENMENHKLKNTLVEILKNCKDDKHKLEEIYRSEEGNDYETHTWETEVVRWCKICGSIVVDIETRDEENNMTSKIEHGAFLEMKSPKIFVGK
jgi:hypothetical protein